jgi:hypothetical protein
VTVTMAPGAALHAINDAFTGAGFEITSQQ